MEALRAAGQVRVLRGHCWREFTARASVWRYHLGWGSPAIGVSSRKCCLIRWPHAASASVPSPACFSQPNQAHQSKK